MEDSSHIEAVQAELLSRDQILALLKKKLLKAQTAMKFTADKSRLPHPFQVGDLVFVKLRPHRQVSVAGHRVHKLSKRFYGPLKLLRAIGEVAFELELPLGSRIHHVFHVSQLKSCQGALPPSLLLPPHSINNQPLITPIVVLNCRTMGMEDQVLIQWSGLFPEDAAWEAVTRIRKDYPELDLEDKVSVDGERDVTGVPPDEGESSQAIHEKEGSIEMGPKRMTSAPKWLKDYVRY